MSRVSVQQHDFDPGAELAALTDGRTDIGAAVSFVGLVRDIHGGENVSALTLDHYPGMTERELERSPTRPPIAGRLMTSASFIALAACCPVNVSFW